MSLNPGVTMRRTCALFASLFCFAFSDCAPSTVEPGEDADTTQANFWCSFYTGQVVYGQMTHLCTDEINALGEDGANAWFDESVGLVLGDCTDYVNTSPTPEEIEYIVKHVCGDGYDENSPESVVAFEQLTCDDVTSADFVAAWPMEELCPCIATGSYEFVDGQGRCTQ